jgi:hypothetical protein
VRMRAMERTFSSVEMDDVNAINPGIDHAITPVVRYTTKMTFVRCLTKDLLFDDENRTESKYGLRRRAMRGQGELCCQYGLFGATLPMFTELHLDQWHLSYVFNTFDRQSKKKKRLSLSALVKRLNLTCSLNAECWSSYCFNSRCQCAPDYEPEPDNNRCRKNYISSCREDPIGDCLF